MEQKDVFYRYGEAVSKLVKKILDLELVKSGSTDYLVDREETDYIIDLAQEIQDEFEEDAQNAKA